MIELDQEILRLPPGRSARWRHEARETILFAAQGRGALLLDGDSHALEHETAAYVAPGRAYTVETEGPDGMTLVRVLADLTDGGPREAALPVTLRASETEKITHPTVVERAYRVLLESPGVTQFIGFVPPGRAKDHYHRYEEVATVLQGEGVLHVDGRQDLPFRRESELHFPAGVPHCVENTGTSVVRVLGVFHPRGSPAEAYDPLTHELSSS